MESALAIRVCTEGRVNADNKPMMKTTTISSIKVKAALEDLFFMM
jgi:hypothetical protein